MKWQFRPQIIRISHDWVLTRSSHLTQHSIAPGSFFFFLTKLPLRKIKILLATKICRREHIANINFFFFVCICSFLCIDPKRTRTSRHFARWLVTIFLYDNFLNSIYLHSFPLSVFKRRWRNVPDALVYLVNIDLASVFFLFFFSYTLTSISVFRFLIIQL